MRRIDSFVYDAAPTISCDDALHRRIRAEFAEMPGLTLTLRQAARLFDLEPTHCEEVLNGLVAAGALAVSHGVFVRGGTGRRWT
jgi:hypothetical protein